MINRIVSMVIFCSFLLPGFAQQEISDGPYIFIEDQWLVEKSVVEGTPISVEIAKNSLDTSFNIQPSSYTKIEKIAALSDIHGQYDLAIELLKNNRIINDNLEWSFGKGHLVIVGDIFDRGDKVTEMLWLVHRLEQEAKEAGGRVHFLLGNHEYMILHNDLRYLHEKYPIVSAKLGIAYDQLFGTKTILGRWLRSKHTIIQINDHIFVHGGISQSFLASVDFDIETINETMRQSIDRSKEEMKTTDFYSTYYGSNGPIWYRGYFYDPISEQALDSILTKVKAEILIVGHCSNKEVVSRYNQKVFGVDSSIKRGQYGEVLILENGKYHRGTISGERIQLK